MSGAANSAVEEIKKGVVNRLDKCGALSSIRAQIRANVYRALLDPHGTGETPADVKREAPLLLTSIVAEFLKSAELERTSETFLREANCSQVKDHRELAKALKCPAQASSADSILAQVVESVRAKRTSTPSAQAPSRAPVPASGGTTSHLSKDEQASEFTSMDTGAGIGGLDRAREIEKTVPLVGSSKVASAKATMTPTAVPPPSAAVSSSSAAAEHASEGSGADAGDEPTDGKTTTLPTTQQHRTLIVDDDETESPQRSKFAAVHSPSPSNSASISECQEFSESHDISADLGGDSDKSDLNI
jgi:hypothetical protein